LGVKEWGLELIEVYDGHTKSFLGHPVFPCTELSTSQADAIIVCLYDKKNPMSIDYLPEDVSETGNMYRVFEAPKGNLKEKTKIVHKDALVEAEYYGIDMSLLELNLAKTPEERIRDIGTAAQGISELRNALSVAYAK